MKSDFLLTAEDLMDNMNDGLAVFDQEGLATYVNEKFCRITGYGREEIIGHPAHWFLDGPNRDILSEQVEKRKAGGKAPYELVWNRKDGKQVHTLVSPAPIFDSDGRYKGAFAVVTDISIQKRTEKALRESEQKYRQLVEHAPAGILEVDLIRNRFLSANEVICHYTGYTKDEFVSIGPYEILSEESKVSFTERMKRLFAGEEVPETAVFKIKGKNGREFWVMLNTRFLFEGGKPYGAQVVIHDVTALKATEEALRASEQRFREVLESSLDVAFRYDMEKDAFDYVSPSIFELTGYTAEEVKSMSFEEVLSHLHPEDLDDVRKELENENQRKRLNFRLRRKDGGYRWVADHIALVKDSHGKPVFHVGSVRDITELKRAEDQFRILYDLALGLASLTDLKDGLRLCVSAAIEAAGLDAGGFYLLDSESGALDFVVHQGLSPEFVQSVSRFEAGSDHTQLVLSGKPVYARFDEMGLALSGAEKREGLRFLAVIPMSLEGRIIGSLNVASHSVDDISRTSREMLETIALRAVHAIERLKAQEALRRNNEKLKRLNKEMQEFVFVASHDLQEPLRKIQMFSDLLQDEQGPLSKEQTHDYFERLQLAATRMRTMIDGLLTYARVTTRGQAFTKVNLSEPARKAYEILGLTVEKTSAAVEMGDLPAVEADPSQMVQLFHNLLDNALKFRYKDRPPVIKIYSERAGTGRERIMVEDKGIGFDEKNVGRIFVPFQRLHGKDSFTGTGMGLSICKRIVERHGGTITAKSTQGKGATFIIELPVKQAKKAGNRPGPRSRL